MFKTEIKINGRTINNVYRDSAKKELSKPGGNWFFRTKPPTGLKIVGSDFDWMDNQPFDTEFIITSTVTPDSGAPFQDWSGKFYKTYLKIDFDDKVATIQKIDENDDYTALMNGVNNEYDLFELLPEVERVYGDRQALVQVYIPGNSTISNYLYGGRFWEQSVKFAVTDDTELQNTHKFAKMVRLHTISVRGSGTPEECRGDYVYAGAFTQFQDMTFAGRNGVYELRYIFTGTGAGDIRYIFRIVRTSDSVIMFETAELTDDPPFDTLYTLNAVAGGSTGSLTLFWENTYAYMRMLTNALQLFSGQIIPSPLSANDLYATNDYFRVVGYSYIGISQTKIVMSPDSTTTPTQYGLNPDNRYYSRPDIISDYYPVALESWGLASLWFKHDSLDETFEIAGRATEVINGAYKLSAVIKSLLAEIDPSLSHEATTAYSEFFYDTTNPIDGEAFDLFILPKSIITEGFGGNPLPTAKIRLSDVFTMLANVYQCYPIIENGKLRIEFINWFHNGGSYSGPVQNSIDLTAVINPKNGKSWDYRQEKITYDSDNIPNRIEFSWMDESTRFFEGYPIILKSNFAEVGTVEEITPGNFSSDFDYILINNTDVSKNGFALITTNEVSGLNRVIYKSLTYNGQTEDIQNGLLSWLHLHPNFWKYDLPTKQININGSDTQATTTKYIKKQNIKLPSRTSLDPNNLIKTSLGFGRIEKISVNLSSRMNDIELSYAAE